MTMPDHVHAASYVTVSRVLLIIALLLFVLKAFGVQVGPMDLGWLGLAFLAGGMVV
jgi:hypothetical protein